MLMNHSSIHDVLVLDSGTHSWE